MSEQTPASRQLLSITKGLLDDCEAECVRLRALNAELVAALKRIGNLECGALDPTAGLAMFEIARGIARAAIAKAKG